jgi:hypothetical protein
MPSTTQSSTQSSTAIPLSGGYVPTPASTSAATTKAPDTAVPLSGGYTPTPTPAAPAPTTTPIQNPTPASSIKPATTPTLPQPQAQQVQQSYFDSVAENVQSTKDALQTAYDTQSKQIQDQLDTLKQQQSDALAKEEELSQPFQQQLEQTQEQQLNVTSNFQKNQALVDELNSLVNEANARLSGVATDFTSKSYGTAVYNKTLSDITARAGLIQSAMAAYNGQIGQAYTMIDRSVAAINADRTDQMNYYQTILSLNNQSQLDLNDQAKTLAQQQLAQLQSDAADAQKTADTIKQAMLDPATAQAYAQAGVTLTDTPEQINQKLSDYGYSQELATTNNQMAAKGYTPLIAGQSAPAGAATVTTTDSRGAVHKYYSTTAPANGPAATSSDPDVNSWLADFYGSGGQVALPALGIGNAASGTKLAILNGIAQNNLALGISGSDFAAIMSSKQSAQKALTKVAQNQGMMTVAEQTANNNFDQIESMLPTIPPKTVSSLLNGFIQSGEIQTGDPNLKPLAALITSTMNEYAKVITGQTSGSGVSDAARNEAQSMLSVSDNTQSMLNFIATARQEMQNRVQGYATAKDGLYQTISSAYGDVGSPSTPTDFTTAAQQLAQQQGVSASDLQDAINQYGADQVYQFLNGGSQ